VVIIPCGILAIAVRPPKRIDALATKDPLPMRWKLLVITSVAAALVACGLWCVLAIILFGSAAALAQHDWLLPGSLAIPLLVTAITAFFVYRHTARRRKTQAAITVVAVLSLAAFAYVVASLLLPNYLVIPRTYEGRHAR
jgi:hypothetical protein